MKLKTSLIVTCIKFQACLFLQSLLVQSNAETSRAHSTLNLTSLDSEGISTTDNGLIIDAGSTTYLPIATEVVVVEDFTTVTVPVQQETTEYNQRDVIRTPGSNKCECGIPRLKAHQSSSTRVIGGRPAVLEEFPWFAAITKFQHHKVPRWKVVCGAALINDEFAITAAHCLFKYRDRYKETLEVVFNIRDVHNITTDPLTMRYKIREFFVHPHYDEKTLHNDIALVRLQSPIDLQKEKRVTPICLPKKTGIDSYANRNGSFVGFGHQNYGSDNPGPKENSRTLFRVDVPILTYNDCLKSKVPTKKNITTAMVCAGETGKDACINDSGGPLMISENGRTVLVGLSSWGVGCGLPNYYGIYTKVSQYLTWVRTISGAPLC